MQTINQITATETPFDKRQHCWFCGEPNSTQFTFPRQASLNGNFVNEHIVISCPHPTLSVPSCGECSLAASKVIANSIWAVNKQVKQYLIKRYRKDLAIGINWTKQALADSEFEQGNFAGFQRSAWFMYEVAKGRVNYLSWSLVVNGLELDDSELTLNFSFDDVIYPSIDEAINHYAKAFGLDAHFFRAVYAHMITSEVNSEQGRQKEFAQAVRFCRLLVGSTPYERQQALKQLKASD